jgi:hypothetical protein
MYLNKECAFCDNYGLFWSLVDKQYRCRYCVGDKLDKTIEVIRKRTHKDAVAWHDLTRYTPRREGPIDTWGVCYEGGLYFYEELDEFYEIWRKPSYTVWSGGAMRSTYPAMYMLIEKGSGENRYFYFTPICEIYPGRYWKKGVEFLKEYHKALTAPGCMNKHNSQGQICGRSADWVCSDCGIPLCDYCTRVPDPDVHGEKAVADYCPECASKRGYLNLEDEEGGR